MYHSYNKAFCHPDSYDLVVLVCLQEHFLLTSKDRKHNNTDKIRKAFGQSYDMFLKPALKNNSEISAGRAKGGLCTMWKKGLTKYVSKI